VGLLTKHNEGFIRAMFMTSLIYRMWCLSLECGVSLDMTRMKRNFFNASTETNLVLFFPSTYSDTFSPSK